MVGIGGTDATDASGVCAVSQLGGDVSHQFAHPDMRTTLRETRIPHQFFGERRDFDRYVQQADLCCALQAFGETPGHHRQHVGAVQQDRNAQIPIDRLREYEENAVIGKLNSAWWSIGSFVPNAQVVAEELAPKLAGRSATHLSVTRARGFRNVMFECVISMRPHNPTCARHISVRRIA